MTQIKKRLSFLFCIYTVLYILIAICFYKDYPNTKIVILSAFILILCIPFFLLKPTKKSSINIRLLLFGLILSFVGEYLAFYYQDILFLKISVAFFFSARVFLYAYSRQFIKIINFNTFRDFAIFLFALAIGFSYCMYFLIEDSPSEILPFCIILAIIDAILFITSWYIKRNMVKRNYFRIGIGSLLLYDMLLGFNYFGTEYLISIYPLLIFAYLYKMFFFKTYYSHLRHAKD